MTTTQAASSKIGAEMNKSLRVTDMKAAISGYLEKQLQQAFDDEFDKMVERVKERQSDIIAKAAVSMSRNYSVQSRNDELVITVRDFRV